MTHANPSLFRPQALQGSRAAPHGAILLARVPGVRWLTLWASAGIALVIGFLVTASYTRKAHLAGILMPAHGVIRVVAAQPGVVVESRAREGEAVAAGQVLFVLASERAVAGGTSAEQAIAQLMRRRLAHLDAELQQLALQSGARLAAQRRRAEQLAAELQRVDAQARLQARRVALAGEAAQRHAALEAAGFVSAAQGHDRQAELLDQEQRQAELQRARGAAERELASVQAELRDAEAQAQRERLRLQREQAALEQDAVENGARRQIVVRAPQAGTVSAVSADEGQPVAPSQALAALLPAGSPLEAELYAPAPAAGFVKPGMAVRLRYRAYPYQKFGQAAGEVREVSAAALRPEELALPHVAAAAGAPGEPLYRVRVALERQSIATYGRDTPLKPGTSLDASVLLERRRLVEWVLDPLVSLTGRL